MPIAMRGIRIAGKLYAPAILTLLSISSSHAGSAGAQQQPPASAPPAAGGVQASGPTFRVVRSISGSKGTVQGGRYIMEDPRTIFYLPQDKQVIVYFEWEGPTGAHTLEGYWKNPDGKVAAISDFKYEAKDKRFGGFWTLTLSETMQTGMWILEARVDGEATGTHSFQVLAAERPADAIPIKHPLAPAEIYKRAVAASVSIEKLNSQGAKVATGSGFFIGENVVATSFQTIDGASALRVLLPDGRRLPAGDFIGWDRRQDWAVFEVEAGNASKLERAKENSGAVGDHCLALDASAEGTHVIVECEINGVQQYARAGERFSIAGRISRAGIGGPLLNEYCEVVGILGGSLLPGFGSLDAMRDGYPAYVTGLSGIDRTPLAVPIRLVALSPPRRTSLADMAHAGQLVPLVSDRRNVLYATLCKQVRITHGLPTAVEPTNEFSRRDQELFLLIQWWAHERRKTTVRLRVYDLDNRVAIESAPSKVTMQPEQSPTSDGKIPIAALAPGVYRVDVLTDDEVAWRTYFRILE
jgi:hypothetical protein